MGEQEGQQERRTRKAAGQEDRKGSRTGGQEG